MLFRFFGFFASLRFCFVSLALLGFFSATALAERAKTFSSQQTTITPTKNTLRAMLRPHNVPSVELPRGLDLRGWDELYAGLVRAGTNPELVASLLSDRNLPKFEQMTFNVSPQESRAPYARRNSSKERRNALNFYVKHRSSFINAEKQFGVPASIILAIIQIETRSGKVTGRSPVFYRLARLASALDEHSLGESIKRNKANNPNVSVQKIIDRGVWLRNTFLPHVQAAIELASINNISPLELRGSSAGALGIPQFLPGNILRYGIDGNKDGRVDVFNPSDAIPSVANFLVEHGWTSATSDSRQSKKKVILEYNRSDPYAETVISMAHRLAPQMK